MGGIFTEEKVMDADGIINTSATWTEGVATGFAYSLIPLLLIGLVVAGTKVIIEAPMRLAGGQ